LPFGRPLGPSIWFGLKNGCDTIHNATAIIVAASTSTHLHGFIVGAQGKP
jgi:hypothetical protein